MIEQEQTKTVFTVASVLYPCSCSDSNDFATEAQEALANAQLEKQQRFDPNETVKEGDSDVEQQ